MKCLTAPDVPFDIGIVGAPFDTAVSYRPGEFLIYRIFFGNDSFLVFFLLLLFYLGFGFGFGFEDAGEGEGGFV